MLYIRYKPNFRKSHLVLLELHEYNKIEADLVRQKKIYTVIKLNNSAFGYTYYMQF